MRAIVVMVAVVVRLIIFIGEVMSNNQNKMTIIL